MLVAIDADHSLEKPATRDGLIEPTLPHVQPAFVVTAVDDGTCADADNGGSYQNGNHHGVCSNSEKRVRAEWEPSLHVSLCRDRERRVRSHHGVCAETEKGGSDQNGNHHGVCAETEKGGSDHITVAVQKQRKAGQIRMGTIKACVSVQKH